MRKSLLKRLVNPIAILLSQQKMLAKSLVILNLLGAAATLTLSTTVSAVGMGGINVSSALGQQLKAEISLVAISKAEKDSLVARMASPEAYKSAGLEYPYGNKFKFEIQSRADGEPYIKLSSAQPVNDPFVSLLVELSWSSGKLSREYTFLLDPVDYVPAQPAQAPVQAVAPAVQTGESAIPSATAPVETPAAPIAPMEQVAPISAATTTPAAAEQAAPAVITAKPVEQAVPVPEESATKPVEQAVPVPEETAAMPTGQAPLEAEAVKANNQEWVEVQRGDTMYKIATQYKLADMNLERMLVALYRVNAEQFDGKNMNRIRVGKILHLPSDDEYASVTLPEAINEIHAQAADWNAYRQKLAGAAPVSNQAQGAQQVASGKITSSVADRAPVAKESAKEVLKLSKGEAPGDQAAAGAIGKSMSDQDKKNAAQEEAIAKSKASQEEQMRAAKLEKNLKDMEQLAKLKAESAALAQPPSTPAPAAAPPAPAKAPEASASKSKPKEVKPEPSLLDQMLDEPLYLAGGIVVLLVLGGVGFMLYKRKKKPFDEDLSDDDVDVGSTTGRIAAPVIPSPDTGDFTRTAVAQAVAPPQSEHVDPISEADLFLNFGRDVQAEEILKEALQNTPSNHQIHLKLLGIYANRKDVNSFANIARQLQESGDENAWQQAAVMGLKLEPNNPMYGGAGAVEDAHSATTQVQAFNAEEAPVAHASALDFDFDVGASAGKETPSPEQDFLGGGNAELQSAAEQDTAMDFDITSSHPSSGAAESTAMSDSSDLVFDVTGSHASLSASQPEASKPADDGGMMFTLDFPVENAAEKPASAPPSAGIGLAGISLNFDDTLATPSTAAAGGKDDHWQEVATKLDLAKAYQEMGDNDGAREILEEVIREGDAEQRVAAQTLFEQLG